ncbi:CCR4-NOT transcription complex subunit 2-like [Oscarella lobularis]|uniref:CCR4-NOT transcription complex subunit 2-like n=1 Tax=Oscarella lobularis TaxID=121494 RepID=UPI0033141DF5
MAGYRNLSEGFPGFNPFPNPSRTHPDVHSSGLGGMRKPGGGLGDEGDEELGLSGMPGYFNQSGFSQREKELRMGSMYGVTAGSQAAPGGFYNSGLSLAGSGGMRSQFPGRGFAPGPSLSGSSGNLTGLTGSGAPPMAPGSPAANRNPFGMGQHGLLSQGSLGVAPGQQRQGVGMMGGMTAATSRPNRPNHIQLAESQSGRFGSGGSSSLAFYGISQGRQSQGMMSPGLPGLSRDPGSPSHLNPADFPALNRAAGLMGSGSSSALTPSSRNSSYAGFVTRPPEQPQEFQMHNEDFPALPGSRTTETSSTETTLSTTETTRVPFQVPSTLSTAFADTKPVSSFELPNRPPPVGGVIGQKPASVKPTSQPSSLQSQLHQSGLGQQLQLPPQSSSQQLQQPQQQPPPQQQQSLKQAPGAISLPAGMLSDQFGMLGLLTFIRAAETDHNLVALALGSDLTTLGLNLNSAESLYTMFASPFAEAPLRPQDVDYTVPPEYLTSAFIRDKLAGLKLNRYGEDLLFYLYYSSGGDLMQLAAAAELYQREWRYHKEERAWVTHVQGAEPTVKTHTYEQGRYCFFDVNSWRKVQKEFHLQYDKLEERPILPTFSAMTPVGVP